MDKPEGLKFYIRDDGIFVFEFYDTLRTTTDKFAKIVRSGFDNPLPKLRVIYDLSKASMPTSYFLRVQGNLYNEYPHQADEKLAYIINTIPATFNEFWLNILRNYLKSQDTMCAFYTQTEAIMWLLA